MGGSDRVRDLHLLLHNLLTVWLFIFRERLSIGVRRSDPRDRSAREGNGDTNMFIRSRFWVILAATLTGSCGTNLYSGEPKGSSDASPRDAQDPQVDGRASDGVRHARTDGLGGAADNDVNLAADGASDDGGASAEDVTTGRTLDRGAADSSLSGTDVTRTSDVLPPRRCTAPPDDLFINPFNKRSAHHRPVGTGAVYAPDGHPSVVSWMQNPRRAIGMNVGAPWGVSAVPTDASDGMRTIEPLPKECTRIHDLPVTIRMPKEGFETPIQYNPNGCRDGIVVIYDGVAGVPHEIFAYSWSGGAPKGSIHKTWDIRGLGHGTRPGDRLGTSASGVAALFGILRGEEINDADRKVEHALQMSLPRKARQCANMLSREVTLPAVAGDGSMNTPGENQGNIPYGALMALPPVEKGGPDLGPLGLSPRGRRLVEAVRDYGIYVVDGGNCPAMRTDQHVGNADELKAALAKIYPHIRRVLNNDVLGSPVAGGGTPLAPNCAFDAQ